MSPTLVRRTWIGALSGGALFGSVALVQILRSGVSPVEVLQPLLVLTTIGATVGGLGGPLIGQAWSRWRGRGQ